MQAGRRLPRKPPAHDSRWRCSAVITLLAVVGPWFSPWAFDQLDWQHLALPPGHIAAHWFGTDRLGRDLFVRTLCGVRLSLLISILASLVSVGLGVAWGAVAGFAGGPHG